MEVLHVMKSTWVSLLSVLFGLGLTAIAASASTISYQGTLSSPEDSTTGLFTFTLTSPGIVVLQTYGFGGGTNAAGTLIMPGGTDPFLGIFQGTGPDAPILTDGFGDPYGTSLDLSNYENPAFGGCGPANAP